MKYIFPLILLFVFSSCKMKDATNMMSKLSKNTTHLKVSDCPKNVNCKIEILKDKTLSIGKDDIGKIYPKITNGDNIIVKYLYKPINEETHTDGNQSELLIFEINKDTKTNLENTELQEIKMLFQKNCFCRDIFGYYKVTKGSFKLEKSQIDIEFVIPKVGDNQMIKKLHLSLE